MGSKKKRFRRPAKKAALSENARTVLNRRYLKRDETGKPVEEPEDMFWRVAVSIAQVESAYGKTSEEIRDLAREFYDTMVSLKFLPNSPTLMNAGRELQQLAACFVLPIEDSMESIFDAIKYAALVHQSGGGTGFSFSRLRPKNDIVRSTGGVASGPVSFLKVFNAATEAVKQGGTRRGANMGVLRVDHPDILEFITCKQDSKEITNFNLSVGLTKEFMEALAEDGTYPLINPRTGEEAGRLDAGEVFNMIVDSAWRNGEPGIVFLDKINEANPTPHVGEIESTNPCGEQPLLPNEACNLGSINLSLFVKDGRIDYAGLKETVETAVIFLDDVIDASRYPLPQIDEMVKANRKIGLGVMGFADMLLKLRIPYNSDDAVAAAREVMSFIDKEAKVVSVRLGKERGSFPNFQGSIYDQAGYEYMRNATVTTIAPTGTLSIIAGASSGIEPLFSVCFVRNVLDGDKLVEVNSVFKEMAVERGFYSDELMEQIAYSGSVNGLPEIPEDIQKLFVTAHDIDPEYHIKIQAAFQEFVDNACSKTINFPREATKDEVANSFLLAYKLGCKGVTVYRDGSRENQVLSTGKTHDSTLQEKDSQQYGIKELEKLLKDKPQKTRDTMEPRTRPRVTMGRTEKIKTGCGNVYVTVNEDDEGLCEVFVQIGKSGGCAASQAEAVGRLISMALRAGVKVESIIKNLRGIRCPQPAWTNGGMVLSCADAIGIVLENYVKWRDTGETQDHVTKNDNQLDNHIGACPECGGHVRHENGCITCVHCGYSKCG